MCNCYERQSDLRQLEAYLSKVAPGTIEDISEISNDECKRLALKLRAMKNTGDNIMHCFRLAGGEFDKELAAFVNSRDIPLGFDESVACAGVTAKDFILAAAKSNDLHYDKLEDYAIALQPQLDAIEPSALDGIGEEQIYALCRAGAFALSAENLRLLIDVCPGAIGAYAQPYYTEFVSFLEDNDWCLDEECIIEQLQNHRLTLDDRLRLLSLYDNVPLKPDYDDELFAEIVNAHLSDEDLYELPKHYAGAGELGREAIVKRLSIMETAEIKNLKCDFPMQLNAEIIKLKAKEGEAAEDDTDKPTLRELTKSLITLHMMYLDEASFSEQKQEIVDALKLGGCTQLAQFVDGTKPDATVTLDPQEDAMLLRRLCEFGIAAVDSSDDGKVTLVRV